MSVQSSLINTDNVGYLLQFIETRLNLLEKKTALVTGMTNQQLEAMRTKSDQLVGELFKEGGSNMGINSSELIMNDTEVSPDALCYPSNFVFFFKSITLIVLFQDR